MPNKGLTFSAVRELGLALPRSRESLYYRLPALKVDGQMFVVQTGHRTAEPNSISVPVGFKRRDELVAADPRTFYLKRHYRPYGVVLVRLNCITRENLRQLLRSAYDAVLSGGISAGQKRGLR